MKEFEFTVYAKPQGKGRPRFARTGKGIRAFTPKKDHDYERHIAMQFLEQGGTVFEHKYIGVSIVAYFPIPKTARKADRLLFETGYIPYDHKPDVDNVAKSVLDGLNGVAWVDDKQVVSLKIKKFYAKEPRVDVKIQEVYVNDC